MLTQELLQESFVQNDSLQKSIIKSRYNGIITTLLPFESEYWTHLRDHFIYWLETQTVSNHAVSFSELVQPVHRIEPIQKNDYSFVLWVLILC